MHHLRSLLRWVACGLAFFLPSSGDSTATGALSATRQPQSFAASTVTPTLTGGKAVEHLKASGQYDSLAAAITAARYAVKPFGEADASADHQKLKPDNFRARSQNPAHGLNSTFSEEGLTFTVRTRDGAASPAHTVGWRLRSLGYGAAQTAVPAGTLRTAGQRVELVRTSPAITEWFVNEPAGLEHGFTLPERPTAHPRSSRGDEAHSNSGGGTRNAEGSQNLLNAAATGENPLRLVMAVTGDLTPHADATGQRLDLRDASGRTVLSYEKLKVWDATGAELPATMTTGSGEVRLVVNDATARYPLTIDPIFMQEAYLKASNAGVSDYFGLSVAISGDTVVVGAPGEASNAIGVNGDQSNNSAQYSGAAYVFVRSGTTWSQQAYLKASNTEEHDLFGRAVAVSGDTVVIGTPGEDSNAIGVNGDQSDNSAVDSGAVYVFVRSGTTWSQQAYLKASNTKAMGLRTYDDGFGSSVGVSGDTVVVGASNESSNATGVNGDQANNSAQYSGAAYVFVRSGTTWSQQAYLKASNTEVYDLFGRVVAVSGDTVVVGTPSEDSNAIGVNGDQSDNSAQISGAVYVFVRSGTTWSQQAYLKASNTGAYDEFGSSLAISGNTVVVGAPHEGSDATGINGNQNDNSAPYSGAAYVFVRSGTTWSQQAYLKASNTQGARPAGSILGGSDYGDRFGGAVALSGDIVVVGAIGEDSNATGANGNQSDNSAIGAGAAYVYVRNGGNWSQKAYLKASNPGIGEVATPNVPEIGDWFGRAVAVAGDTVVVGAEGENSNAAGVNGNQTDNSLYFAGAAYVFRVVNAVTGQVDVMGETEAAGTLVSANEGPGGAHAGFALLAPYYGAFTLDDLPPSSVEDPPKGYKVWANLNFRTGHRHEYFKTPVLGEGLNPAVNLPADRDWNTGSQFVMYPGFVEGGLFLKGPAELLLGHPSALRGIVRLNEPGADYRFLPDNLDSRVTMQGKNQLAPTATSTAAGGLAQASFEGEFNPATSAFAGDYQLVLAGLNGNRTVWGQLFTRLLLRGGSMATPESYVDHTLLIQEFINPRYNQSIEVRAGQHNTVDLNYCFGEIVIEVEAAAGTLRNPTMQIIGGFSTGDGSGLDFQGNARWYSAETRAVAGTPTAFGVSPRGRLVVMLPQGTYPVAVTAEVENPPGVITPTTFDLGVVKVGCGEHLKVSSGMQVQITSAPECGGSGSLPVSGTVVTPVGTSVSQVFWQGSDHVNHLVCEDCGQNPAFSFMLPANGTCADSTFTVTALTTDGRSASITRTLRDTVTPEITVGVDKTVECGTVWNFDPVTSTDACSGVVTPVIVSTVTNIISPGYCAVDRTWRATDACGNSRDRTQRVTVHDNTPPVLQCPDDIVVNCPQQVFFSLFAGDNCGSPTVTSVPPNGSHFGFGTTEVHCTAVDACGLTTECSFMVTVLHECVAPVARPDTFVIPGGSRAVIPVSALLANVSDADGDAISLVRFDAFTARNVAVTQIGSALIFTAPESLPAGVTEDTFNYWITDGTHEVMNTVHLPIKQVPLVYEGFAYSAGGSLASPTGPLRNGGVGWDAPWTTAASYLVFPSSPLSLIPPVAGFPISGGSVVNAGSAERQIRPITNAVGQSLWFSAVLRGAATANSTKPILEFGFDGIGLRFSYNSGTGSPPMKWLLTASQTVYGSDAVADEPALLVAELRRIGELNYEFRFYVNPTGAPPPDSPPAISLPGGYPFNTLRNIVIATGTEPERAGFDEIRVGRSYESVTASDPVLVASLNELRFVPGPSPTIGATFTLPFGAPGAGTYALQRKTLACPGGSEGIWEEVSRQTVASPGVLTFVDGNKPCGAMYRVRTFPVGP